MAETKTNESLITLKPAPADAPTPSEILKNVIPKLFIDGEFVDAISGRTFPVEDPRNGEILMHVAEGDKEDIHRAVKAARKAFEEGPWSKMSGKERRNVLLKFADLWDQHKEELSKIVCLECGKPLVFAKTADNLFPIEHLRYFAGWADKIHGMSTFVTGFNGYTIHEPIGVIGAITPWNVPLLTLTAKMAPALAAGNTVVIKVSEMTPLSALRIAQLAAQAGLPKGVLNIVPGYGQTAGAALASHLDVDKITLTGSVEVGRKVMELGSVNIKDVTLELGGKSALIIYPDVDLDWAVSVSYRAVFNQNGQICIAASRIFLHEDIYDAFLEKAVANVKSKTLGDPFAGADQGPQINEKQMNRILGYIESGKKQGARLLCGGYRVGDKGYYIAPAIFADVQDGMTIAREEIFGPVSCFLKFKDTEEVIKRANSLPYGLAGGVFTNDLKRANHIARSLRCGVCWINTWNTLLHSTPFGGYKMSGIGRECSQYALQHYTQVKSILMSE